MRTPVVSRPPSLNPDELLVAAYIEGSEVAQVIVDAWRFHEPVTVMDAPEFDNLIERCRTTFITKFAE